MKEIRALSRGRGRFRGWHISLIAALVAALLLPAAAKQGARDQKKPAPAAGAPAQNQARKAGLLEEVLRLNNLGIAEMEQFRFTKAAGDFQQARSLDPKFLAGMVNLGIAWFYDRKNEDAIGILNEALQRDPKQIQAHFVLSLLLRSSGNDVDALQHMKAVIEMDPGDAPALYFAGSLESAMHEWQPAIAHFNSALNRDPMNVSIYYALAKTLIQKGDTTEAEKVMAQFQEWKTRGTGTSYGNQYGEQGRYANVVRVSSPGEPADSGGLSPRPKFVEVTSAAGINFVHAGPHNGSLFPESGGDAKTVPAFLGSGAAFIDTEGKGWPDLLLVNASADAPTSPAYYRNNHDGTFSLATGTGIDYRGTGMGVASGDYDGDGRPDIFIAGYHSSALYHNEGNGKFRDVTSLLSPRLQQSWAISAAFADYDHDGDLDLYITCAPEAGGAAGTNLVYRNNGDGTLTEIGEATGTAKTGFTPSLAFMDFNDSRDVDLLLIGPRLRLFSNNRDGSFKDVSGKAGVDLPAGFLGLAVGDFDGDGRMDICLPPRNPGGSFQILWNRGDSYESQDLPVSSRARFWSVRAFDYDNDGDLDILLVGDEIRLLENLGRRKFVDVTALVGLENIKTSNARAVAISDYDRDGDLDLLITRCGAAPLLLRNDGGNRNNAFRLSLEGKSDNRFGLGTKIEWASGGMWQHREIDGDLGYLSQSATEILLGMGKRTTPDFVRVLWPTGVLQTEIPAKATRALHMAQLDRKGTSCPILYAWDGTKYRFVSDFLGGSAMGYLEEPGRYGIPDTDEYVKISHDQLRPRGDRLSLKMVNQLEEVILFDAVRLLAVDHASDTEIYPNERLQANPPFPEFRIFTAPSARNVISARDGKGAPWTRELQEVDRQYVRGFQLLPYKGYAEEHSLELDLGDLRGAKRALLLMDGWIDYATSSSNFAAAQAGLKLVPPYLQVWDAGKWRTVIEDMGFPAGLPKTMIVDLTGKLPASERTAIRIVTNMRIYWDRIRVESAPEDARLRVTTLEPVQAATAWVGYPRQWSPDGLAPFAYDYDQRDAVAPWKTHAGGYTRFGDVRELLRSVDDLYVILGHGEEITAEFSSRDLPPLPPGWTRDWLLYVDGYGKDMDLHSQYPDRLEPLPRHRDLPYRAPGWSLSSDALWESFRKSYLTREK
jgi:cytochrome c-type biogenesis protein CcmH/NrfG